MVSFRRSEPPVFQLEGGQGINPSSVCSSKKSTKKTRKKSDRVEKKEEEEWKKKKGEILEEREEKEERKENPEGEANLLPSPTMTLFPDPRREIIVPHPR